MWHQCETIEILSDFEMKQTVFCVSFKILVTSQVTFCIQEYTRFITCIYLTIITKRQLTLLAGWLVWLTLPLAVRAFIELCLLA